jgi:glycosyltransferase involved in cell wall biosynthesis
VAPGDPAALSSALSGLLTSESERQQLGEAARAAAAGPYSWDRAADLTLGLYRDLLRQRDD